MQTTTAKDSLKTESEITDHVQEDTSLVKAIVKESIEVINGDTTQIDEVKQI